MKRVMHVEKRGPWVDAQHAKDPANWPGCPNCLGKTYPIDDCVRYVLTNLNSDRTMRILTFSAQGQNTYATREEAEAALALYEPTLRTKLLGDRADTLMVVGVPCWPGHHDPKKTVWDPERDDPKKA